MTNETNAKFTKQNLCLTLMLYAIMKSFTKFFFIYDLLIYLGNDIVILSWLYYSQKSTYKYIWLF